MRSDGASSLRLLVGAVLCLLVMTAGGCIAAPGDPDRVCDGVPSELGGCDPDQPGFAGTDCEAVGREFGAELDRRVLAIIDGPALVNGESQAVRVTSALGLVSARANQHLRRNGLVDDCGVDEFLNAAETAFSNRLRADVGSYLYDDQVKHTYEEWLEAVRRFVVVIDQREGETEPPA
jgi:hypothetical protein